MKKVLLIVAAVAMLALAPAAEAKGVKVDICHVNGSGNYSLKSVSENALSGHLGHGDLVVGVDADENCQPTTGGNNTPPVAVSNYPGAEPTLSDPLPFCGAPDVVDEFGTTLTCFDPFGDPDNPPPPPSGLSAFASDADGDTLTYHLVVGSFDPGEILIRLIVDSATGGFNVDCIGATDGVGFFDWYANDGTDDSNVARMYVACAV